MNFQPRLAFIFITVVLDMIGIGIIIPSLPDVIRRFIQNESQLSLYFGGFISVYALMQFVASPLLGCLSDRFGRRPILLVSIAMAAVDYLFMAMAPSLEWLFVGRIIAGLTGANITVAMAYIADISDSKSKSANFGLIGAAFGLGFIIGPAIGGLLGNQNPAYPFFVSAGMNLANFLFGYFVLPESHPVQKRRKVQWSKMNPLSSLARILNQKSIVLLVWVHFLFQMSGQTHPSIWTLYTGYRFHWDPSLIGMSLATVGVFNVIAQGGLTRVLTPKIGEYRNIFYGTLGLSLSFFLYGMADQGWMMFAIIVVSAVAWTAHPALQSMISRNTPPENQGELQGALVSLTSLAAILNPLIVTRLFAAFTGANATIHIPGMPYFFAAATSFCGFLVFRKTHAG